MTDAPETIYLQWIPGFPDIPVYDEVTWCFDPINEDDTEYIRADIAAAKDTRIAELEGELETEKEFGMHYHSEFMKLFTADDIDALKET